MITSRYQRAIRNLGGYAGGTSRLARPPTVLEEPDVRPGLGCSTVPVSLAGIGATTITSASTTPDGTVAVIITNVAGVFTKYAYDTSDWSLIDTDVITGVVNDDTVIAGDDGFFYNLQGIPGGSEIMRWPIIGVGGAPTSFASYTGADSFIGNNGILAFDLLSNLYAGGQDGATGDAVLLSLDRTTGARSVLHQTSAWDYIEPACCTIDGAVWGWALDSPFTSTYLFRWDGTLAIFDDYPAVDNGSAPYPCTDSSVGFCPGSGLDGVSVSPTGDTDLFDCLDGIDFTRDWNGPSGVNLLVPSRVVADARALTCG